ncbi:MAG: hypothetical protein IKT00_11620 [Prevotella sp.]|nr:hypothetical protein [Prevotella sp.]
MSYNEQIKTIIDAIRPDFDVLGTFAFQGFGDPMAVTSAFVSVFEAYQKAKEETAKTFGSESIEVDDGSMLCTPNGGQIENDDSEMLAVYTIAKEQGFLPPPMLGLIGDFTMQINRFFMAAQKR